MYKAEKAMIETPERQALNEEMSENRLQELSTQAQKILRDSIENIIKVYSWGSNPDVREFSFFIDFADGKINIPDIPALISAIKRINDFIEVTKIQYEGKKKWKRVKKELEELIKDETERLRIKKGLLDII